MASYSQKPTLRSNGYYYYSRRIPTDLVGEMSGWAGGWGKHHYRVTLDTKNEAEAKRLARVQDDHFHYGVNLIRDRNDALQNGDLSARHNAFEHLLRERRLHPSQAPSVNAPVEDQRRFIKVRNKLAMELVDYQHEVGLVQNHTEDDYEEHIRPSETYWEVQRQIDFLEGKGLPAVVLSIPTLGAARQLYKDHVRSNSKTSQHYKGKVCERIDRLTDKLALLLGGNRSADLGYNRTIDSITKSDIDAFIISLRRRENGMSDPKAWTSVGREIGLMNTIYNHAYKQTWQQWPLELRGYNPFSNRKKTLEDLHEDEVRQNPAMSKDRRPFKPSELNLFLSEYVPRMNEQAHLITLIGNHTGCRITDAAALMMSDYWWGNEENPIPFIHFQDNAFRRVTKNGFDRQVPLFGEVFDRIDAYFKERSHRLRNGTPHFDAEHTPLFPSYGREDGSGGDAASAVINKHFHDMRQGDVRLTFHSFRHTLQHKFLALPNLNSDWGAYVGGWRNAINKGDQKVYQKQGVPLGLLKAALEEAHSLENWGNTDVSELMKRGIF